MFSCQLYLYDLNFVYQNEEIDIYPALLNEDISLTIERERDVFVKTNSDLSLNFSNLIKINGTQTIFSYLNSKIKTNKFRIKISFEDKIVFDGYVENESISYQIEDETLSLNAFAIEKEFWKRCENILFSDVNLWTTNDTGNGLTETFGNVFNLLKDKLNERQYFSDIITTLELDVLGTQNDMSIFGRRILLRNNTLQSGLYWLDREKLNLKDFFEIIINVFNLEFKIDYDNKKGIFQKRLVTTGTTIDISKDTLNGLTFFPEIEKFDLIKINDIADINNSELFEFNDNDTFHIDTLIDHESGHYPSANMQVGFEDELRVKYNIPSNSGIAYSYNINYNGKTLKLFFYFTSNGINYVSGKPLKERVVPNDTDENQFPNFKVPVISDAVSVSGRKIVISGGEISIYWTTFLGTNKRTIYPIYELQVDDINFPILWNLSPFPVIDNSLLKIKYFSSVENRDAYLFNNYETIIGGSYLDEDLTLFSSETQIKRAKIFELENKLKLSFHEDKNGDGILNTDEDKPKGATRIQTQLFFGYFNFDFYQDLINSYKNILKSTSKIECEVNNRNLFIGDKVTINLSNEIYGDFIITKNEIDLVNGISKIEALSEVI